MAIAMLGSYTIITKQYGSLSGLKQRLDGMSIILDCTHVNLGRLGKGMTKPIKFWIRNCTSSPIAIVGISTSCKCVTLNNVDVPFFLKAGQWCLIKGQLEATAVGYRQQFVDVYFDREPGKVRGSISYTGVSSQ
jgi:hypothetical protein